jgi:hypothetical protein
MGIRPVFIDSSYLMIMECPYGSLRIGYQKKQ